MSGNFGNPMDAARMAEASDHLVPEDQIRVWPALIDIFVIGSIVAAAVAAYIGLIVVGEPY